jgi:hypothetical protein
MKTSYDKPCARLKRRTNGGSELRLPWFSNRNTILLVVLALGLIVVYGANTRLDLLKKRTIENIKVHRFFLGYGYSYNFSGARKNSRKRR